MEVIKNIREKLTTFISGKAAPDYKVTYKALLDKYLDQAISVTIQTLKDNPEEKPEEIRGIVKENKNLSSTLTGIEDANEKLIKQNKELRDIEKRLVRADWGEKFRTILFRILTTISIAAIILLTGYLAQEWGIALPFRMGLPVS